MALGISRTYLSSLTTTSSSRVSASVIHSRLYASAAAVATNKNRPTATARKTVLSSASNSKVSARTESPSHTSSGGPAAKASIKNVHPTPTKAARPAASKPPVPTQAEQMEQLGKMLAFQQQMPTADIWGQKVETLDVLIPCNIITSRNQLNGLSGMWSQFLKNRLNGTKNMISLVTLASYNAIPGVSTSSDSFFRKLWKWPMYVFGANSVKPTSWLATTRNIALDTYRLLNTATAKNDLKEIKRLASAEYLTNLLGTLKKRVPNLSYIWRFHREVNPTQIVSLRVTEGYLAPEDPKFGNRLMVHALVKFDTEQSLEIYDRQGNPVHKPAPDTPENKAGHVPAERQRVIQYLVLEKRMWYDSPWLIRDEIWETKTKKS